MFLKQTFHFQSFEHRQLFFWIVCSNRRVKHVKTLKFQKAHPWWWRANCACGLPKELVNFAIKLASSRTSSIRRFFYPRFHLPLGGGVQGEYRYQYSIFFLEFRFSKYFHPDFFPENDTEAVIRPRLKSSEIRSDDGNIERIFSGLGFVHATRRTRRSNYAFCIAGTVPPPHVVPLFFSENPGEVQGGGSNRQGGGDMVACRFE